MRVYRKRFTYKGKHKYLTNHRIDLMWRDKVIRFPGFPDKESSRQLGKNIERLMKLREGNQPLDKTTREFIKNAPPKLIQKLAENGVLDGVYVATRKSLAEHIEDFKQHLTNKNTEKRSKAVVSKVNRIVKGCGFKTFTNIKLNNVESYLADLRNNGKGISAQTYNWYRQAIKQFCNWMVQNDRATESHLTHLFGHEVKADRRHDRRALEIDEVRRLLETTNTGPTRFGMGGHERYLLYKLAVETGLRRNELRNLKVSSFDFKALTLVVRSGYTKNKREAIQSLRPDTAAELKQFFMGKLPNVKVFGGTYKQLTDKTAKMIQADLKDAGIDYQDESGQYFDFHALRGETGTLLARSGVHPKVAQSIMRHSDINLTMSLYTHTLRGQESEAVGKLPDLSKLSKQRKSETGTDG